MLSLSFSPASLKISGPLPVDLSNVNSTGGYAIGCDGSLVAYVANALRWGCLDGKRAILVEAGATNFFLNSETPATQSITVSSQPYTVSFWGPGTITFSGSHSGSLVGTGENDRVSVTFTASAGVLNCTVSGVVSRAQVESGAVATSYIVTAGSADSRAADLVTAPLTGDYTNGVRVRGTFRLDAIAGNFDRLFVLDDDTSANRILFYRHKTAENFQLSVVDGGANQGVIIYSGATLGDTLDVDLTITPDAISGTINGDVVSAALSGAYTAPTIARLGHSFGGANIPARLLCSKFLASVVAA